MTQSLESLLAQANEQVLKCAYSEAQTLLYEALALCEPDSADATGIRDDLDTLAEMVGMREFREELGLERLPGEGVVPPTPSSNDD